MNNNYEILGEKTVIYTMGRNSKTVYKIIINTEDFSLVNSVDGSWSTSISTTNRDCIYAVIQIKKDNGKPTALLMHRLICGNTDNKHVDHINHDTLDNRKENLRTVTPGQNQQNRAGAQKNSKSGIRGVYWSNTHGVWMAQIRLNGKKVWQKRFLDAENAKIEVEKARLIYLPYSVKPVAQA